VNAYENIMCGDDPQQAAMFSDISPEERVLQDYPWRLIRVMEHLLQLAHGLDR
jgi:hypothetical protein